MRFKKGLICLGLSVLAFSTVSMAAEPEPVSSDVSTGTVDFTGSIVNTPCAITASNQNLKVNLGNVKALVFTAKGARSAGQPLNIVLSNCTVLQGEDAYHAAVTFSGVGADTGKTALAVNAGADTSGAAVATGVGIQISDSNDAPMILDAVGSSVVINKSEMTLPFTARYISIADAVTPGLANGHADFTVTYP